MFSAGEKVAQLEEEFGFHKKETLKSFAFSQLNVIFFNLRGKTGEASWVQVTATQLGSSY